MNFAVVLCLSSAVTAQFLNVANAQTVDAAMAMINTPAIEAPALQPPVAPPTADSATASALPIEGNRDALNAPQADLPTTVTGDTNPVAATTDIVVTGRVSPPPQDPLQALNIQSYELVQAVDVAVIGPVATGYEKAIPEPVRNGLRNVLLNLQEPVNFLNFLLQFKIGKAVETLGRFAINTAIGVAGLVDMAKRRPFNLPYRSNGFANTLGFHGVKTGPFLFLPIIGPTTARDLVGYFLDRLLLPTAVGKPFNTIAYSLPTSVLGAITRRNENKVKIENLRDGATNPYTTLREDYLQARQIEIDELRGRHRLPKITPRPGGNTTP